MKHYHKNEWMQYVRNELDEATRNEYEDHLYQCDECLDLYLLTVEEHEAHLPQIAETSEFTNAIMDKIDESKIKPKKQMKKKTVMNYLLAAAMTILFMSSGLFDQLMSITNTFENDEQQESFVFSIIDNSESITEQWKESLEEGNRNE